MHAEFRWVMAELERDPSSPCGRGHGHAAGVLRRRRQRGARTARRPRWLRHRAAAGPARRASHRRPEYDDDFAWMFGFRTPIIAAVNGAAAGVGLALALFCDLRFGAATAKLTTAAPKLGLPAEYGMSWILPRLVGVTRADDLLLSGRVVTVADTVRAGGSGTTCSPTETAALAAATTYARSSPPRSDRMPSASPSLSSTAISIATTPRRRSPSRSGCSTTRWRPPSTARVSLRCARSERPSSDPLGPTCDRPRTDPVSSAPVRTLGGWRPSAAPPPTRLVIAAIASGRGRRAARCRGRASTPTPSASLACSSSSPSPRPRPPSSDSCAPTASRAVSCSRSTAPRPPDGSITRISGISWIGGLEVAERPQLADTLRCDPRGGRRRRRGSVRVRSRRRRSPAVPSPTPRCSSGAARDPRPRRRHVSRPRRPRRSDRGRRHRRPRPLPRGRAKGATGGSGDAAAAGAHDHAVPDEATDSTLSAVADGHTDHTEPVVEAAVDAAAWPRPWDPTAPIDFSGVAGRQRRTASSCRAARRRHAARPARVRRRHERRRARLPLDRRREHRVRALHQHRPHQRRQVPRPDRARVARLRGRRRRTDARVGDVHRHVRHRSTTPCSPTSPGR